MLAERALRCLLLCCLAHVAVAQTVFSCSRGQACSSATTCWSGDPNACRIVAVMQRVDGAASCLKEKFSGPWAWVKTHNGRPMYFRCSIGSNFGNEPGCPANSKFHLYYDTTCVAACSEWVIQNSHRATFTTGLTAAGAALALGSSGTNVQATQITSFSTLCGTFGAGGSYALSDLRFAPHCTCTDCSAGKYEAAGVCTNCAAGKFSSATSQTSSATCSNCGANTNSDAGASSCPCAAGYTGASCTPCAANQYKASSGSSACTNCPSNSFSPAASANAASCVCRAGFSGNGSIGCTRMPSTKTQCPLMCPAPAGYAVTSSGANLEPCGANHYNNGSAMACTTCPWPQTFTAGTGLTSVAQCACLA